MEKVFKIIRARLKLIFNLTQTLSRETAMEWEQLVEITGVRYKLNSEVGNMAAIPGFYNLIINQTSWLF